MIKFHTLGTSHGAAEYGRSCSVNILEVNGRYYVFDCGGNIETKMKDLDMPMSSIKAVFISHMHEDHAGSLSAIGKHFTVYNSSEEKVKIMMPEAEGIRALRAWMLALHLNEQKLERLEFEEIYEAEIYRDEFVAVSAIATRHIKSGRFPSYAFVVESVRALSERAEDFEQMLDAPSPSDSFWNSRNGGSDTKNATDDANIPILLTTGYNDFYVGGIFKMWNSMSERTKKQSALLVSPYNHSDGYNKARGLAFPNGGRREQFGRTYQIDWFDNIRTESPLPYNKGEVTYYRTFEERWQGGFYFTETEDLTLTLGKDAASFCYNPLNPPAFCCEGNFQEEAGARSDVVTVYTSPIGRDVFIKGQMRVVLTVSSTCQDSTFYVGISIKKSQGDYALRHDITSLCYQLGKYDVNDEVVLNFCFVEYAFLLKKDECLRVDISSTDANTYVSHTNKIGPYHLQSRADIATNTVYLDRSHLILPIEKPISNPQSIIVMRC